jgi:hypothetical protein
MPARSPPSTLTPKRSNLPKLPKLKLPKPHMVKPVKAKMPQKIKPKLPGQHTNHPASQQRAPAGTLPSAPKALPAPNTTYDFYIAPNDAPAAPNQSGIKTHLETESEMATQHLAKLRCPWLGNTTACARRRFSTAFRDGVVRLDTRIHQITLDSYSGSNLTPTRGRTSSPFWSRVHVSTHESHAIGPALYRSRFFSISGKFVEVLPARCGRRVPWCASE